MKVLLLIVDKPRVFPVNEDMELPLTCNRVAGVVVPTPTFPLWVITNLGKPDEDAVKRSPTVLSIIIAAFADWAEILATGTLEEIPKTWNLAELVAVPPITRSRVDIDGESTVEVPSNCQ